MFGTILVVFTVHCNFRMKIGFYSNIVKKYSLVLNTAFKVFLTVIFKLSRYMGLFKSRTFTNRCI